MNYNKLIKQLRTDDSVESIEEVLTTFINYNNNSIDDIGLLELLEESFIPWLTDNHADLLDSTNTDSNIEDIFLSIFQYDEDLAIKIYSEYIYYDDKISDLIDLIEEWEYEQEDIENEYDEY